MFILEKTVFGGTCRLPLGVRGAVTQKGEQIISKVELRPVGESQVTQSKSGKVFEVF